MTHCGFLCKEKACAFEYIFSADFIPFQVCGILLGRYPDALSVNNKLPVLTSTLPSNLPCMVSYLKHVCYIIHFEKVVYSDYFHIVPLHGSPEGQSANPSKAIDTYFNF